MQNLISICVVTANILGSFQDPFEFAGSKGSEIDSTRQKVFERVVLSEDTGVTLGEVFPSALVQKIEDDQIRNFLMLNKDLPAYPFFRKAPHKLLRLDKALKDEAAQSSKTFAYSILGSSYPLEGTSVLEIQENLLHQLREGNARKYVSNIDIEDPRYQTFSSREGQVYFYWLNQSFNLYLAIKDPSFIQKINKTKAMFAKTLGDAKNRAEVFRENVNHAGAGVIFTQQADSLVVNTLSENHDFFVPTGQSGVDGTYVILREGMWDRYIRVYEVKNYSRLSKGVINVVVARHKESDTYFLLASCHGQSTSSADGREQIKKVMELYHSLKSEIFPDLQLLIGADANTKSEKDVTDFLTTIDKLGLVATNADPTIIKQRAKEKKAVSGQKDYIITLKTESGGALAIEGITVGFDRMANHDAFVPTAKNMPDHIPVIGRLKLENH